MRRQLLLCSLLTVGCSIAVQPSLDAVSAVGVAREPMRRLRSEALDLYYPASQARSARAMATRLQGCMQELRTHVVDPSAVPRARVIWHGAELNNAYVASASAGSPQEMVLPTHTSLEMFNLLNLGLIEVPQIGCHEAVHYTVFGQTHGFWRALNVVFGDLLQPNVFLDLWFHEGLATFYEARLTGSFGRPDSLLWRGLYSAGVADGALRPGDLSPLQRELGTYGGHYLVGMHFVEWLAERFGEAKLWQLVDSQGRSVLSPFGITLRFAEIYGGTLEALFDAYRAELPRRHPKRPRPATQQTVWARVGLNARLATCPAQGLVAVVRQDLDAAPRLSVVDADGHERWSRNIIDVLPGRQHAQGSVSYTSGLSFRGDCSALYAVTSDLQPDTQAGASLWEVDVADGAWRRQWDHLSGVGGGVAPDGGAYAYVHVHDTAAELAVRALPTGDVLFSEAVPGVASLGGPAFAPDNRTLAFAGRTARGFNLWLRHPDGRYEQLTDDDAFNYAPHWRDAEHLVFLRGTAGRPQGHVLRLADRAVWPVTDAPYAALDVSPLGDGVAFLSADGWGWEVARVPLPPAAAAGGGAAGVFGARAHAAPGAAAARWAPAAPFRLEEAVGGGQLAALAPAIVFGSMPADPGSRAALPPEPEAPPAAPGAAPMAPDAPDGEDAAAPPPAPPPDADDGPLASPGGAPRPVERPHDASLPPDVGAGAPAAPAAPVSTAPDGPDAPAAASAAAAAGAAPAAAASAPPAAAAGSAAAEPFEDSPYSMLDGLLVPQLRMPLFTLSTQTPLVYAIGAQVVGGDRLGLHRYSLQGSYGSDTGAVSFALAYINNQLAPWTLQAQLGQVAARSGQVVTLAGIGSVLVPTTATTRGFAVFASRPLWSHGVGIGLQGMEADIMPMQPQLSPGLPVRLSHGHLRLFGPSLALAYSAAEATPYAGAVRALAVSVQASYYPAIAGNTAEAVDTRLGLGVTVPLPLSPRHTLLLTGRGRALWRAPRGSLWVGGPSNNDLLALAVPRAHSGALPQAARTTRYFHDRLGLSESLRGYEDVLWRVSKVAIGEATYRYPIIIDRGLLSLAYILPSAFVQQLDLTAFGGVARGEPVGHVHHLEVVGVGAQLLGQVGQLGITLGYQAAYRFQIDELPLRHLFVVDLS